MWNPNTCPLLVSILMQLNVCRVTCPQITGWYCFKFMLTRLKQVVNASLKVPMLLCAEWLTDFSKHSPLTILNTSHFWLMNTWKVFHPLPPSRHQTANSTLHWKFQRPRFTFYLMTMLLTRAKHRGIDCWRYALELCSWQSCRSLALLLYPDHYSCRLPLLLIQSHLLHAPK